MRLLVKAWKSERRKMLNRCVWFAIFPVYCNDLYMGHSISTLGFVTAGYILVARIVFPFPTCDVMTYRMHPRLGIAVDIDYSQECHYRRHYFDERTNPVFWQCNRDVCEEGIGAS